MLAQEIRQIEPRQHMRIDALAIDVERDGTGPSRRVPRIEIGTPKQRGHATRQQDFRQMPAHGGDAC
jgi:hypothetical protein